MANIDEIIAYAISKKILIDKGAAEYLAQQAAPLEIIDELEKQGKLQITKDAINVVLQEKSAKSKPRNIETEVVIEKTNFKPFAKDIDADIKIRADFEHERKKELSQGTFDDFLAYFRDKFEKQKRILTENKGNTLITIPKLQRIDRNKEVQFVGMVFEKQDTKNGHVIMTVEDLEGTIKVLIPKDDIDLIQRSQKILEDDVLMFKGVMGKNLFIAKDFVFPDIPFKAARKIEYDINLTITSDIHIGHKKFAESGFQRFINWLNGKVGGEKQKEQVGKIKYIVMNGDLVDGIGIYPDQENELVIKDIYKQYETFEEYIEQIPEYIHIIIGPGNHDAVRVEDPQPKIPEKYLPTISQFKNVHLVSSPSSFDLHGVNVAMYHGRSMDMMIDLIPNATYEHPEIAMEEYLRRRHVVPRYGSTKRARAMIFPEREDLLTIRNPPDIFVVGHVHTNGYSVYRSTLVINPGAWQKQTAFQAKQGHITPTPGVIPTVNLKTFRILETKFIQEA